MNSTIAEKFSELLIELEKDFSPPINTSKQIYFDLWKIRDAQWSYKKKVNRGKDWALSEIFHDLVAHYLRASLSKEFEIHLEVSKKKLHPDILIKKEGKEWTIIEVKTNLGWVRSKIDELKGRLDQLSREFGIPIKRIFYVIESYDNTNNEFKENFNEHKDNWITQHIIPLFKIGPLPYYYNANTKEFKGKGYEDQNHHKYKDEEIEDLFNQNEYIQFSTIIKRIIE